MPIDFMAAVEIQVTDPTASGKRWEKAQGPVLGGVELRSRSKYRIPKAVDEAMRQPDFVFPDGLNEFGLSSDQNNFLRIERYLEVHLDHLRKHSFEDRVFHARFRASDGDQRFKVLQTAGPVEFKKQTLDFAMRMHAASDHMVNNGIMVAIRRDRKPEPEVAVLKLDLHNPAAHMVRVDGHAHLEAVRDALDLPEAKALPKAAVYPDDRADSDVMVVDQYKTLFFLRTIEAQQFVRGPQSAALFQAMVYDALEAHDPGVAVDRSAEAAAAIGTIAADPMSAQSVLDGLGMLDRSVRENVLERIATEEITVDLIDASRARKTYDFHGIKVSGLASVMRDRVSRRPALEGDSWELVIRTDFMPEL